MRIKVLAFAASVLLISNSSAGIPQSTSQTASSPQRDPQALGLINLALSRMGGVAAIVGVQDFSATGQITYYWANKEVQGQTLVKGRGTGQFRLDAELPDGVRSWAVSDWAGIIKNFDGTLQEIPFHNALNFGSLTLPTVHLAAALQNPATSVSYLGLVTRNGTQVHDIRIQTFSAQDDADGLLQKLSTRDFYIEATSLQVLSVVDMVHSDTDSLNGYQHELLFSGYQSVAGIVVPLSIVETVGGQQTWALKLQQMSFNVGLQDADFQL